jgi:hypothetical protein
VPPVFVGVLAVEVPVFVTVLPPPFPLLQFGTQYLAILKCSYVLGEDLDERNFEVGVIIVAWCFQEVYTVARAGL